MMLSDLGRREEALQATAEAVEIRRRLAAQRPDAFLPDLATSLNNLGMRLSNLGRREEALQATAEAVEILRRLAAQRPDAFLPDLAMSLNNLGNQAEQPGPSGGGPAGDRRGGGDPPSAGRAASRRLPARFGQSLNNLGSRCSATWAVGRRPCRRPPRRWRSSVGWPRSVPTPSCPIWPRA